MNYLEVLADPWFMYCTAQRQVEHLVLLLFEQEPGISLRLDDFYPAILLDLDQKRGPRRHPILESRNPSTPNLPAVESKQSTTHAIVDAYQDMTVCVFPNSPSNLSTKINCHFKKHCPKG